MKRAMVLLRRRLLGSIPVLLIVIVLTFLLLEAASGDAVDAYLVSMGGGDAALVETLVFDQDKKDSAPHEVLSEREMQVFLMLASGRTISEIAEELCLSIKTVSTHKFRLMRKMNHQTSTDLVRYAIRHRLIAS